MYIYQNLLNAVATQTKCCQNQVHQRRYILNPIIMMPILPHIFSHHLVCRISVWNHDYQIVLIWYQFTCWHSPPFYYAFVHSLTSILQLYEWGGFFLLVDRRRWLKSRDIKPYLTALGHYYKLQFVVVMIIWDRNVWYWQKNTLPY